MSVEVIAIGGYQEVGKNMTAVKIGEDVIIFDPGVPALSGLTQALLAILAPRLLLGTEPQEP